LPRNDQDRVLWTLTEHGGSMAMSDLARSVQTRQTELDVVLQELERAGEAKLTEINPTSRTSLSRYSIFRIPVQTSL
jgi:hypothetical protein